MRKIVIVDCISTGTNYVWDVINFGFKPIVLELKPDTSDVEEYNKKMEMEYERVDASFDIIYEQDTYEETLEIVKKLDSKLILPPMVHAWPSVWASPPVKAYVWSVFPPGVNAKRSKG